MSDAIDIQLADAIVAVLGAATYVLGSDPTPVAWVTSFTASRVWTAKTEAKDCPTPQVQVIGRTRKGEAETRDSDIEAIEIDICLACHVKQDDDARLGELNRLAEQLAEATKGKAEFPSLDATYTGLTRSPLWDRKMLSEAHVFVTVITTTWNVIRTV